jgi:hypothetical protein
MWTQLFFIYNFISLAIASSVSVKTKDIVGAETIKYLNTIILLICVSLVTMLVTTTLTRQYACDGVRSGLDFNFYSGVTMLILNIVLEGMYIAIVSNSNFGMLPNDVKSLLTAALVLNSLGTAGGAFYLFFSRYY